MLIHEDLKNNFYKKILESKQKNVIIISNHDLDALCTTVILTDLFERDEVMYSLVVIKDWVELEAAIQIFKKSSSLFVLINCGAFRSLFGLSTEILGLELYVFDCQRPVELSNVYANQVVKVICRTSEINSWNLPTLESIVDMNEESESEDENDAENRDITQIALRGIKKRNRTLWEQTRERLQWEYAVNSYIEYPSAVLMLQLAHSLGMSSAELSWCACVALTHYYVEDIISLQTYTSICVETMRTFTRLYAPRTHVKNDSTLRISFNKELPIPLYNHWTLHQSVVHDVSFITSCRLWTQQGAHKLRETYATLGIPLNECNANFHSLTSERRQEIFRIMENELIGLNTSFATFFSHFAFSRQFNSADYARITALKMDFDGKENDFKSRYFNSMEFLKKTIWNHGGNSAETDQSLKQYQKTLENITQLAFDCMRQSLFLNTNTFYALYVPDVPETELLLTSSHLLNVFMMLALRIFASIRRGFRIKKPLLVSITPRTVTEATERYCLVSGLMPLQSYMSDTERKTLIPRLFAQLHEDPNLETQFENINPNVIYVKETNRIAFFDRVEQRLR
ncbi:unnamed protein product [Bursaphelenchus okinawaensis]|uniref:CDC45-like protein n=1 Tax=Bursaphelenchus okinawaensis TaxID=465554 RepID=A0A811KTE3_9BILA|nr:unnamed protein product [Bursaphelenchus okinawaensis]CAG9110844.1 unnamed protein product [Bursaphelenchus okinawaensis]